MPMPKPDSTQGAHADPSSMTLEQLFAEFTRLADLLHMPDSERAGILGVSTEDWLVWSPDLQKPDRHVEYRRRLNYALPLMCRSLATRG